MIATDKRIPLESANIIISIFTSLVLQGCLEPTKFTDFSNDINISISMAACMRDVCKKNPDRGVDLILSVSVTIQLDFPCLISPIQFFDMFDLFLSFLGLY